MKRSAKAMNPEGESQRSNRLFEEAIPIRVSSKRKGKSEVVICMPGRTQSDTGMVVQTSTVNRSVNYFEETAVQVSTYGGVIGRQS